MANSDDTGQKRAREKEQNNYKTGGTVPERIDGPAVKGVKKGTKPGKGK